MIKAGIFDVGGVLHESSGQRIRQDIVKTLGITEQIFEQAVVEPMKKFERGRIDEKEFWEEFKQIAGIHAELPSESLWLREFKNDYGLHADVLEIVEKLKNKSYKIAVLSNTIAPHAQYQYNIGLYQKFDIAVLSNEVGMAKPDPRIYQLTLDKLGLKPEETFFVDDLFINVQAATQLGIHGIVFKNATQLLQELHELSIEI